MKAKSNAKLYAFLAGAVVLAVVLIALEQRLTPTAPAINHAQGLPEWAISSSDQQAWRDRATTDLTYDQVMSDAATVHQVTCWTGRMQEQVHVQNQDGLMVTYQGISAQSFVALLPDRGRIDWKAPQKGVRIQVCGEVLGTDTAPTPTLGNQSQPILRTGFFVEQVGN